ncbi:DUF6115 domain-containing protein [Paenibacillus sp. NPDC058071]|uniref:DUF6115 domain-containing protein n=1 Tax=Paenibacillus sp. NPDC058071 TaxID=3346326 RepID=UPI0036DA77A7
MNEWTYVVLVGAVVLVAALFVPKPKRDGDSNGQSVSNMELALEQFMENMELDQKELVKLVADFREQTKAQDERKEQRIAELERKVSELERGLEESRRIAVPAYAAAPQQPAVPAYAAAPQQPAGTAAQLHVQETETTHEVPPAAVSAAVKPTIQSRYADLLALYKEGKSIETIAKKLGMNKGEVQLILQLVKQEEAAARV